MPEQPFSRDTDRYNHEDVSIFRFVNKDTDETVGIFHHDGSLARPESGEIVSFKLNQPTDSESEEEGLEAEDYGRFQVVDVEHRFDLVEWIDQDDDEVDKIYGTLLISVEGPLEHE